MLCFEAQTVSLEVNLLNPPWCRNPFTLYTICKRPGKMHQVAMEMGSGRLHFVVKDEKGGYGTWQE